MESGLQGALSPDRSHGCMLPWLRCHCGPSQLLSFPGCEPAGQRRKHSPHAGCSSRCKTYPHPSLPPSSPTPTHPCSQPPGPQSQTLYKGLSGQALLSHYLEIPTGGPFCAGHMPLVTLLLNYFAGLDLERRDQRGLTALMKAAIRDRSECVVALLMAGVRLHFLCYHPPDTI